MEKEPTASAQEQDSQTRPFGELFGKAARALGANPALLLPPALFACVSVAIYALPLWKLHSAVMAGLSGAPGAEEGGFRLVLQFARALFGALFNGKALLLIIGALLARVALGAVHQAGWCGMFETAARGGAATMQGYVRGIHAGASRFVTAALMKLSMHAIPFFFLLLPWAAGLINAEKAVYGLPFVVLLEGVISFVFLMWRPACVIEELGAGTSLGAGAGYAFGCFGDTFAVCALWGAFNLLPLAVLLLGVKAFVLGPLLSKGGAAALAGGLPMFMCAAALAWMLYVLGAAFFSVFTFVLYDDRVDVVPVEEPAA